MRVLFLLAILTLAGCASNQSTSQQSNSKNAPSNSEKLLSQAYASISAGKTKQAINLYLNKVIANCEALYANSSDTIYAARGMTDSLYYMLSAASKNKGARAVGPTCADALYLKGYASIELNRIDTAIEYLNRAIKMSPVNSMYQSELGHIYQLKKQWQKAIDIFTKAESDARTYSPDDVKIKELTRAKRGIGFNLIELGKLDEAEKQFEQCIEIDSNDKASKNELEYIIHLRLSKGADASS